MNYAPVLIFGNFKFELNFNVLFTGPVSKLGHFTRRGHNIAGESHYKNWNVRLKVGNEIWQAHVNLEVATDCFTVSKVSKIAF